MTDKKPSQVFLELWQWRALDLSAEQFAECADAWRQIVSLEEIYAAALRERHMQAMLDALGLVSPIAERSDSDTDGPEGTGADTDGPEDPGDPSPAAQDDSPRSVTYDCASAPMPEEAAKAAAKSAAGVSSLATRKRRALERLEAARGRGVALAVIADAGPGLTITDVMDALDRKPLPLPKLAALEKAMNRLEGGGSDRPPSRKRGRKVTEDDG